MSRGLFGQFSSEIQGKLFLTLLGRLDDSKVVTITQVDAQPGELHAVLGTSLEDSGII